MAKKCERMLAVKDRACARRRQFTPENLGQKSAARNSGREGYENSHCDHQWDAGQQSQSGVRDGRNAYSGRLVSSALRFSPSLPGGIPPPQLRRRDAQKRWDRWGLFLLCWITVTILVVISWTPLQTTPQDMSTGDSSRQSSRASGVSTSAGKAADYMNRFNIPMNHIDFVWQSSGGTTVQRGGKTYHFRTRRTNAGVYVGYAPMHDSSRQRYCERTQAKIDTKQTVGSSLMASGACPNWGKIIVFTDSSGKVVDTRRWENEIHGNVMPHSTTGCSVHAAPGSSEVSKEQEGLAMYSGYMTSCPFNSAVYTEDMLGDEEHDSTVCNFVTPTEKLWFLDTTAPSKDKPYTTFAFHGNGGHLGYDYEGKTKHVGCPPYSPPKITSPMKNSRWLTDPFQCSQLSRCTNHCWPYADGHHCFRSLPAIFNTTTNECLLLGYQTQYHQGTDCAGSPTNAEDKFYCIKPMKNAQTSSAVYVTAHTRPDYELKCPPKEPILNAQWGRISNSMYCEALPETKAVEQTTAEGCAQAVFENSSSDDPSLRLSGLHWATFTSSGCADMDKSCRATAKGRCSLYGSAPTCFLRKHGSISYTSLTAADPSIAKVPDPAGVLPSDPCATIDCGEHGTCSDGKCTCSEGWKGERCDTRVSRCEQVVCQNQGYCDVTTGQCVCGVCHEGPRCEKKKPKCCLTQQDCGNNEDCNTQSNRCVCRACREGPDCSVKTPMCCLSNAECGKNQRCDTSANKCICKPGYAGENCEPLGDEPVPECTEDSCSGAGVCDPSTGQCICDICHDGLRCEKKKPKCCLTQHDCGNNEKCDTQSKRCVCRACHEGPDCSVRTPMCCLSNAECGKNQECDTSANKCICKPGYTGENCEVARPVCTEDSCSGAGVCDPSTGQCTCDTCHYGLRCEATHPDCCRSDADCHAPNGTCDVTTNKCVCDPAFTGPGCEDLGDNTCRGWCIPPVHLTDKASGCSGVDCVFLCCQCITECTTENDKENCYKERMKEEGGGCCLGKSETSNLVAYATAGGVAAVLLLGAVGAGVVYGRKKSRQGSAAEQVVEFDTGTGGRDDDGQNEEAIEVGFDDFGSAPEEKPALGKNIISTTWES